MESLEKTKITVRSDGVVHVHVTGDVMFNLEKATAVRQSVLGRLDHPNCTSGHQLQFRLEEQDFSLKG
jgi:hypothetical protein